MLLARNGFYALDHALLVRSLGPSAAEPEYSISEWNADELWRAEYGTLTEGLLFFAEDLFGCQFAVSGTHIVTFDPESGSTEAIAEDIYKWATLIIGDPALTGHALAKSWRELNGSIPPGQRLVPKLPFALGGEYQVENLVLRESAAAMRFRGGLARQMRGVPPGTTVRMRIDPDGGSTPDPSSDGEPPNSARDIAP